MKIYVVDKETWLNAAKDASKLEKSCETLEHFDLIAVKLEEDKYKLIKTNVKMKTKEVSKTVTKKKILAMISKGIP